MNINLIGHQPHPDTVSRESFQNSNTNNNLISSNSSKQHEIRNKFLKFSTYTKYLTCPDNEKVSDLLQTRHHIAVNSSALRAHSDKPANPTELLNNHNSEAEERVRTNRSFMKEIVCN